MAGSERLEDAIEWFEGLSSDKKDRIIDEFGSNLEIENAGRFRDIVYAIRDNLSFQDNQGAVEVLEDNGMGSLFAERFVRRTVELSPPASIIMAEMNELPQEKFRQLVELSVRQYSEAVPDEEITNEVETNQTSPERLRDTIQATFMQFLRGEFTNDYALRRYIDLGLQEDRGRYIAETFVQYEDITWQKLVFRNTQQVRYDDIEDLRDQQREIRGLLDQLLTIVEDAARHSDT